MPNPYTEDQLVEQPAIGLFAALGWQTVSAMEETFGAGSTLGRETRGEVVQTHRLCAMLTRLNPQQRHVRENLTQEELVIFDILTRPAPELYGHKCSAIFEHVYESYPERNAGVYAARA